MDEFIGNDHGHIRWVPKRNIETANAKKMPIRLDAPIDEIISELDRCKPTKYSTAAVNEVMNVLRGVFPSLSKTQEDSVRSRLNNSDVFKGALRSG